jgi:hypothetical protein
MPFPAPDDGGENLAKLFIPFAPPNTLEILSLLRLPKRLVGSVFGTLALAFRCPSGGCALLIAAQISLTESPLTAA